MIQLRPFAAADFDVLIGWIDNEELLVTIAGTVFTYPLTHEQLQTYLADEKSHSFSIIDTSLQQPIGHAEIIDMGEGLFKIDKLIVGNPASRGKGIGQIVINELLTYSFETLQAAIVELNVFDWNLGGIRCYEKCGFVNNPNKQAIFQVGDKSWTALNMTIDKENWLQRTIADDMRVY